MAFNLLDEPWIPCTRLADGVRVDLGLRDTLARAHELGALQGGSPLETAALYRLLLAVLQRVHRFETPDAWAALWEPRRWDMTPIDAYLRQWRDRFNLFDTERPFYQAADDRVSPKSIISLVPDMASGNNATLFDHHTEDVGAVLTPAQAARALVAAQAFGLAGLSGIRGHSHSDAPCARSIVFLAEGDTLFETLALNLMRYTDRRPMPNAPDMDCPAWEMDDPFSPPRDQPFGYLDHFTWQNRRIMLFPEEGPEGTTVRQMTVAPGLRLDAEVRNPMSHYVERNGRLRDLRFREGRALWRDSETLFSLGAEGVEPPYVFTWLSALVNAWVIPPSASYRYMALGMANNQMKVFFYREEHLPLPLAYLGDQDLVNDLRDGLAMAESAGKMLWGASATLARFYLAPESDREDARQAAKEDVKNLTDHWQPELFYWTQLERPFFAFMRRTAQREDCALAEWKTALRGTAWRALNRAIMLLGQNTRAYKAAVQARGHLGGGLAKVMK